jgi:hypothetical protein
MDNNTLFSLFSLSKKLSDESLRLAVQDHFQKWGSVMNVKVLRDWLGRPYAFVQYEVSISLCTIGRYDGPSYCLSILARVYLMPKKHFKKHRAAY